MGPARGVLWRTQSCLSPLVVCLSADFWIYILQSGSDILSSSELIHSQFFTRVLRPYPTTQMSTCVRPCNRYSPHFDVCPSSLVLQINALTCFPLSPRVKSVPPSFYSTRLLPRMTLEHIHGRSLDSHALDLQCLHPVVPITDPSTSRSRY